MGHLPIHAAWQDDGLGARGIPEWVALGCAWPLVPNPRRAAFRLEWQMRFRSMGEWAALSLDGWLGKHRVAVRRAYNTRAMWQGVWIREGPQMDLRWFGTWKSQGTRALFQCQMSQRWERMKREQWTVRWLFQPSQGGPLRWSGTMDEGGHETSLRVRRDGWQMDGGLRRTPEAWRAGWGCTFHHEWGELGWLQSNGGGLNGRVLWRSMQWVMAR